MKYTCYHIDETLMENIMNDNAIDIAGSHVLGKHDVLKLKEYTIKMNRCRRLHMNTVL